MKEYLISGDGTGKTYGIYEVKKGELLPPASRKPVVKGIATFKQARKKLKELEDKNESNS